MPGPAEEASISTSGLEEGRAESCQNRKVGVGPAGTCTLVAKEFRTLETQDLGNKWLGHL